MPPVPVFKKEKKGEQAQPAPALKGTMNGPRETYSSNMALLLEEGKRETAKLQNDLRRRRINHHLPAGNGYPHHFGKRAASIGNIANAEGNAGDIEAAVFKR